MSKQIKVVIGANFGDEGKGLMTDYFCHELSKNGKVLNIRHNGGAQAGHTVVTPDGKRHVFSHFGSGSFVPHVATCLSKQFIVNPFLFCKEYVQLRDEFDLAPMVYISKDCRVTTPYDMVIDQTAEEFRGEDRHGSCGVGINETVERYKTPYGFSMSDYVEGDARQLLRRIRDEYVPGRLRDLGITHMTDEMKEWLNNEDVIDNWIFQFEYMVSYCKYVDVADLLNDYDNIVLEGAQGLLLDNDYELFAPNLTSSKTGSHYPIELLEGIEGDVEVCYVTRSYFTRHGAGRFPSECMKNSILPSEVVDKTNHTNQFQGQLRYGWFDYPLFISAVQADMDVMWKAKPDAIRSFAVTHLDETCGIIRRTEGSMNPISLPAFRHYLSYGETRETIHCQE